MCMHTHTHTRTHTDSDECPLQSGAGRTTVNTRSSKQAAGARGTRADSKLQHLEDTQPVGKKRAGKSSVLTGTTTCNHKLYF